MTERPVVLLSIHPSVGLNGAGKSWLLILEALRGHCDLWTSTPGPFPDARIERRRELKVTCPQISRRFLGNLHYLLSFPCFVLLYAYLIWRHRVDIVHCNSVYLSQPMLAARLCGRRLVVHVREAREKSPDLLYRFWVACAELLADAIICVSLKDREHFKRKDVAYVPNWISLDACALDASRVPPAALPGLPAGFQPVLVVSQMIEGKGQDFAIDLFAELRRLRPKTKLYLAGGTNGNANNERYRRAILEKIAGAGLSGEIVMLGEVRDILPLMKSAGCVLMASRSESFSRVHLEAMATGCLLIATDVGSTSEVIEDLADGVIIRWGDPAGAAAKCAQVLGDADLVRRIRLKAAQTVAARYAADMIAPEFRRLVLARSAPCAAS